MVLIILLHLGLFIPEGTVRTDLTPLEIPQLVNRNRAETDVRVRYDLALQALQGAQADIQKESDVTKKIISEWKKLHNADGCDLNRNTARWENCKSVMEKKK